MSAHTAGPWSLNTVPTTVGSCHKIGPFPRGLSGETWACVYADGCRIGVDDNNPNAVELRSNARLIAAAPTMYDYIASSASNGCAEASKIMEAINAGR